ncbi:MAG: AEC family transporter [Gammaproteobacteria bacterium]
MTATIISIVFPIFALVLIGFLYARKHAPDMAAANKLNLDIFTPALIFAVLSGKDFDPGRYETLAIAATAVVLGSGLIAWPVSKLLGFQHRTFIPPMMFNNSGNMGLPLTVFAFGDQALAAAVILFMVENTLHFTVGNFMLTGRANPLVLLRMPMLVATIAGLIVGYFKIPIPGPLHESIDLLGQIAIPLMLFSLGVRMTGVDLRDWKIGLAGAIVCPASGLVIAWVAGTVLGLQGIQLAQLIVFGALPPAVLNFMLAEKYNQEPRKVASVVLLGNLASVAVIPVVLSLVLPA